MKERGSRRVLALMLVAAAVTGSGGFARAQDDFKTFQKKDRKAFEEYRQSESPAKTSARSLPRAVSRAPGTSDASVKQTLELTNLPARIEGPGGILVTVPEGALYGTTTFTLALPETNALPPLDDHAGRCVAGLRVALAPDFRLAKPLTIDLPIRIEGTATSDDLEERLAAQAWSPERNRWETLDFAPAASGQAALVHLDHSALLRVVDADCEVRPAKEARLPAREVRPYAAWFFGSVLIGNLSVPLTPYEWFILNGIRYWNVRILCDKDSIRTDPAVGDAQWTNETMQATNGFQYASTRQPRFVTEVGYDGDMAFERYAADGFDPPDRPVVIKINSFLSTFSVPGLRAPPGPHFFEYSYNRIHLRTDPSVRWRHEKLRYGIAHEMFHAFQHVSLGSFLITDTPAPVTQKYLWWVESCAEYASCRLAWQINGMMGHGSIYPKLLEYPLTRTGLPETPQAALYQDLEYDKGYFIDFLAQQTGFKLSAMHKDVLASSGSDDTVLPALDRYLRTATGKELATLYREFAARFLLSDDSPLGGIGAPVDEGETPYNEPDSAAFTQWSTLDPDAVSAAKPLEWGASLPAEYSAKTWAVKLKDGVKKPTWFTVTAAKLGVGASVEIYVLKANRRPKGQPSVLARLTTVKETTAVELAPTDVLYAIVSNPSLTAPLDFVLKIEPSLPPLMPTHTFKDSEQVLILNWQLTWAEAALCPVNNLRGYRVFVNVVTQSAPDEPAIVKQEMVPDLLIDPNARSADVPTKDLGRIGGNVGLAAETGAPKAGRAEVGPLGPIVWSKQGLSLWEDFWDEGRTRPLRKFTYYLDYGGMKMRDGHEERWYESGQKEIEGERRRNQEHGTWRRWSANGQLYDQMLFNEGARQGPYSGWNSDGVLIATGSFERDCKVGPWRFRYDSGTTRAEGSYEYDTVVQSTLTHFVERLEDGRYHEIGTKTGRWTLYRENGKKEYVHNYLHGTQHGPQTWIDEDGTSHTSFYNNGKLVD